MTKEKANTSISSEPWLLRFEKFDGFIWRTQESCPAAGQQ